MQNNDPIIGKKIDGYKIDAILGHGGMGRVYRALDIKLDRYAALKILTQPVHNADAYRKRFDREAQAIAKLKHPNIVAIYRFNEIEDIYYMAMEYVDGADLRWVLREYVDNNELIDYDTVLQIMQNISEALDYAHANGVIHRDIKPSNIMIARDGTAILTDFGLALDVQEGTGGEIFGSPHYIAPEQAISSANAVPLTDFYGLGVILFEILTGSVPYEADSVIQVAMAHISDPLPDPQTINPDLHQAFIPVLQKMLEKEPRDRYPDGEAFIAALRGAIQQAKQDNQVPQGNAVGSIKEYIAAQLPPLPQPVPDADTKSETKVVQDSQNSVSTANSYQDQTTGSASKSRIPSLILGSLVVLLIVMVIISQLPKQSAIIEDTVADVLDNDSPSINVGDALIEGTVLALVEDQGIITLMVNGLNIQLSRELPLYNEVAENDTIRLQGHYTLIDGDLRFDTITEAQLNGNVIEIAQ